MGKKRTKNPAAVELGRLGGRRRGIVKGLAALSPERRREIALLGVAGRRKKNKKKSAPFVSSSKQTK